MESSEGRHKRRQFLRLLGASGASASLVGHGAADEHDGDAPAVRLYADAPDRCGPRRCDGVDYYVPRGAELEFSASVTGKYAVADVRQRHLGNDEMVFRDTCTGEVGECERFTLSFDEPGDYEIRYEAWNVGSVAATEQAPTTLGASDCDDLDDVGCDTIRCRVGEPTVSLEANRSTVTVGETVWFNARLDPPLKNADWTLETYRVADENAESDRATPGGQNWFRRPLEPGEYVAVATATVSGATFEAIERLTVEEAGELEVTDATIQDDGESIRGDVRLRNDANVARTAVLALRTFRDEERTLDHKRLTVDANTKRKLSLSGVPDVDTDAFVAAIELDDHTFVESTLIDRR